MGYIHFILLLLQYNTSAESSLPVMFSINCITKLLEIEIHDLAGHI